MDNNIVFHSSPLEELLNDIVERLAVRLQEDKPKGKPEPPQTKLLKIPEVCNILGISRSTLNNYVKRGTVKAVRLGGQVRFEESDIYSGLKDIQSVRGKHIIA